MKKLIFLCIGVLVFAANLINISYFKNDNFVDVLLSLNEKYNGKVIKINNKEYILTNITYNKKYVKKFNYPFLKSIFIEPIKKGLLIKFDKKSFNKISFALTPEGYGIRIRVEGILKNQQNVYNLKSIKNPQKSLDYFTYLFIMLFFLVIFILLYFFRKKIYKASNKTDIPMGILIQKPLDTKNKIVLFEFNKRKYLMVIGNTNILLDVFDSELQSIRIESQKDFDEFLKLNNKINDIKKYIENAEKLKDFDETI